MALYLTQTDKGLCIHHSEYRQGVTFAIFMAPLYIWGAVYVWNILFGKANQDASEQIILIFMEVVLFVSLFLTIFFAVYVTRPLIVCSNGVVNRKFLGIAIPSKIGTPYTFKVISYLYRPYRSIQVGTFYDLYLIGPDGECLITVRGDLANFDELSKAACIPLRIVSRQKGQVS